MNRRIFNLVFVVVIAIGSFSTAFALYLQEQSQTRGWNNAVDAELELPYRLPLPGINVELSQYGSDLDQHLAAIEAQGFHWIRQIFPWSSIEPSNGEYDWQATDRIVAAAARPGLEFVAVLFASPQWAVGNEMQAPTVYPPDNMQDFAVFVEEFAQRYGEVIDYYQIWDEPNLSSAWGNNPNPIQYVTMLEAAYNAIKSVDAQATIIAAGLAPTTETGPQNISDLLFLSEMYDNGASPYFDAAAAKPYGFDTGAENRDISHEQLNFSRIVLLREEMERRNDAEKPIWGSAFGWNSLPAGWAGEPSIWGSVNRETQLTYINEAYHRAAQEWPWCAGLILDSWQPAAPPNDPIWGFALLPQDNTPAELEVDLPFLQGLDNQTALPGRYPAVSPSFAKYDGEWELGELGADIGHAQDSTLAFQFQGTDIALEVRRDNYRGYLYVTIDDEPANALPLDQQGNSYVILNSADNTPQLDVIPVASGLANGNHTLRIRAEYGWDQWALAGFRVGTTPAMPFQAIITALMIVGSVALLVAIRLIPFALAAKFLSGIRTRVVLPVHLLLGGISSLLLMIGMLLTWSDSVPNLLRREPPGLAVGILTSGLLYFSEPFVLTILAAIVLWLLIYIRLEVGIYLTILWLPFFLYPLELYAYAIPISEVCIILTTSAWLLHIALNWAQTKKTRTEPRAKPFYQRLSQLDYGVIAMLVIATLSLTWADFRTVALREWRTTIFEPILFYAIVRTTINDKQKIQRLSDSLVGAATIAAAIGMVMFFTGEGIVIAEGATRRLAGVYGSPNNVGLLMGRSLPFALASLITAANAPRRALSLIATISIILAAILSQSAGALLIGIPLSLFALLYLWKRRYAIVAAFLAIVSGAIAIIPLSQNPRFARIFDFSGGSTFFRLRIWESAIRMIRDRPLRGFGLDQFLYQYRGRYIFPDAWQEPNLSHPHNIILDLWTRLGLGGLLTMGWLQYHFWGITISVYRKARHEDASTVLLSVAAMASMIDLLAHGLVDNSIFVIDLSFIFMLIILIPQQLALVTFDARLE